MNVTLLNKETEEEIINKLDLMVHICYAEEYEYETRTWDKKLKLIKHLIMNGHFSGMEHFVLSFTIEGISRTCANQLVRHRIASYSQQSLRYVNGNNINIILPDCMKNNQEIIDYISKGKELYNKLIEQGIKKEDARSILPLNIETKISVTMNIRSLFNFFTLRMDKHAQEEIRTLAQKIFDICNEKYPIIFGMLGEKLK